MLKYRFYQYIHIFISFNLLNVGKFHPKLDIAKEPTSKDIVGRHETKILTSKFYQFGSEKIETSTQLTVSII